MKVDSPEWSFFNTTSTESRRIEQPKLYETPSPASSTPVCTEARLADSYTKAEFVIQHAKTSVPQRKAARRLHRKVTYSMPPSADKYRFNKPFSPAPIVYGKTPFKEFYKRQEVQSMLTASNNRRRFIMKVFILLCLQFSFLAILLVASAASTTFNDDLQNLGWVALASILIDTALVIAIFCKPQLARQVPVNYILLAVFVRFSQTVFASISLAYLSSYYPASVVLFAVVLVSLDTYVMAIYATQTRYDYTATGAMVGTVAVAVVLFIVFTAVYTSESLNLLASLAVILAFNLYLVLDIQLVAGGRHKELNYDDYVIATLLLYIVRVT